MNIFTASIPDFNPDQFMIDRPAPDAARNDSTESSRFAELVNDAKRSAPRHEDKKEAYSTKENERLSKAEPKKHDNGEKTVHSENRPEGSQETEDANKGQQIHENDQSKAESGTEAKGTEEKTEKKQEVESTKSDLADNDVKSDVVEDIDNADNETENDNPPIEEPVIASFEQALLSEITIPDQGEEQIAGTINSNEESLSEVRTDTETIKPIDSNTDNVVASDKKQVNTANDRGHINNESNNKAMEAALDKILSGELHDEDGQSEESDSDNKAFNENTGFGNSDLEEIPEEFELNEDLKEKAGLPSTKELPDKYAKKTITDPADFKQVQSQMNITDPDAINELNKIGSDQDGLLLKNMQSFASNNGISNTFKGMSDTSLNSLESINTNTTMSNAELAQNQGMTMSGGKAGAGLLQGNAARAAGFSDLLGQVVYVAKGKNKLDVKINHEEFGKLKINVSMEKGMLNIHVNASEKVVREFLESNVHNIIESLSKDGVSVGGFSVALKDHKDDPEKKFLMDSGLNRQYEHIPAAAVNSARGLVNVFA